MSSHEQPGKPKNELAEKEAAKKAQWDKLLSEGKALEATQYASRKGLIHSDHDVYPALQVLEIAMERIVGEQDKAKESGDGAEFNRLQEEYDRLDREYEDVVRWRMTELDLESILDE